MWYCSGLNSKKQSGDTVHILQNMIGRALCFVGMHDFRIIESTMGFGQTGMVQKVECRRCGYRTTRRSSKT